MDSLYCSSVCLDCIGFGIFEEILENLCERMCVRERMCVSVVRRRFSE